MSAAFEGMMRRICGEMLAEQGVARHGRVTSVNAAERLVKLAIDEDGTTTGWLPLCSQGAGNGWSMVSIPRVGAQAFMVPDMGEQSHGVVVGFTHSTSAPPPKVAGYGETDTAPLQPGESGLVHDSGAFIRLRDGGVIESAGMWKHTGDLLVSGDITDKKGDHGSLDVLRTDYNTHKHTGVVTGGGISGITDKPTP